jgi:hypothetical protein
MDVAGEVAARIDGDLAEELFEFRDVGVKVRRSGTTTVLIEIGSRRKVSRPSDRYVQSDPFHDESRQRRRSELGRPLAGQ